MEYITIGGGVIDGEKQPEFELEYESTYDSDDKQYLVDVYMINGIHFTNFHQWYVSDIEDNLAQELKELDES